MDQMGAYCPLGRLHRHILHCYRPHCAYARKAKFVGHRIGDHGGRTEFGLGTLPYDRRGDTVNSAQKRTERIPFANAVFLCNGLHMFFSEYLAQSYRLSDWKQAGCERLQKVIRE